MQLRIAFCATVLGGTVLAGSNDRILYRFPGGHDGSRPTQGLLAARNGHLYGTTPAGGNTNCPSGCGVVFELSPLVKPGGGWVESTIYSFQGGADGAFPQSVLIADRNGDLYGTTSAGGNGNCIALSMVGCGTIFKLAGSAVSGVWSKTVLYSFKGVPSGRGEGDLADPNGIVFDNTGNLYGFGYSGGVCHTDETGTYCNGGAFRLDKPRASGDTWREKVIHRFRGPSGSPAGPIFDKTGNLYGTAPGGAHGFGGVFRLSRPKTPGAAWTESSVYDFNGNDGAFPEPGLAFDSSSNLYGASLGSPAGAPPYGNIFQLRPLSDGTWAESVVYSFTPTGSGYGGNGGFLPGATGHIYATAVGGGQFNRGVIIDLTPPATGASNWTETILYSFEGRSDGAAPNGGLVFGKDGAIYGTTQAGGGGACYRRGCGTVFKVAP